MGLVNTVFLEDFEFSFERSSDIVCVILTWSVAQIVWLL